MWTTIFIEPLYNFLIILTNGLWGQLALGIIALTLIVKLILFPLSAKAIRAQMLQQKLKPEMDRIKKDIPDQVEQSKALMDLYKKNGASPFSGCLPVLIQIPIILALYRSLLAAAAHTGDKFLYHGITISSHFSPWFFSVDLYDKNIYLALLAGLTQYIQQSMTPVQVSNDDPTAAMMSSMRYVLPVMIAFFAYAVPAAIALYWVVSNTTTIILEMIIKKQLAPHTNTPVIS